VVRLQIRSDVPVSRVVSAVENEFGRLGGSISDSQNNYTLFSAPLESKNGTLYRLRAQIATDILYCYLSIEGVGGGGHLTLYESDALVLSDIADRLNVAFGIQGKDRAIGRDDEFPSRFEMPNSYTTELAERKGPGLYIQADPDVITVGVAYSFSSWSDLTALFRPSRWSSPFMPGGALSWLNVQAWRNDAGQTARILLGELVVVGAGYAILESASGGGSNGSPDAGATPLSSSSSGGSSASGGSTGSSPGGGSSTTSPETGGGGIQVF
jgi:hypothetical protein